MDFCFLLTINYVAVLGASILYFLLGSFWFSALFGNIWVKELEKHNVIIQEPTTFDLTVKMLTTFVSNFITVLGIAILSQFLSISRVQEGLLLGSILAICFTITTVATIFTWESRSVKLLLIDLGYPVLGILTTSALLAFFR